MCKALDAARKVLANLRETLGLSKIEGKQSLTGASRTDWEIDAKAWRSGENQFLVVEVRRHTKSRLKQEHVAAIAYRIQDLGAAGGIIVSPLPMQKGAELVAASAEIAHVRLSSESTTEDYLAEFMGSRFLGASITEAANAQAICDAEVIRGKPTGGTEPIHRADPLRPAASMVRSCQTLHADERIRQND